MAKQKAAPLDHSAADSATPTPAKKARGAEKKAAAGKATAPAVQASLDLHAPAAPASISLAPSSRKAIPQPAAPSTPPKMA
jgi:hypothetical protein